MFFYICTGISVPEMARCIPDWRLLLNVGHDFVISTEAEIDHPKPDAIILMSVSRTDDAIKAMARWPGVPLFVYHWDCYSWVWTNPRPGEYDYKRYGNLLKQAKKVWAPSHVTAQQAYLWWSIKSRVVWPAVPTWEEEVADDGYALCTLREQPDHHWDWFERACQETGYPHVMTKHYLPHAEYRQKIARCSFIVSHLREASTGGLSLIEAYRLGKPVVVCNSGWNGAIEYFDQRAIKFSDYGALVSRLLMLRHLPLVTDMTGKKPCSDHRTWVDDRFSDKRMLSQMMEDIRDANAH